MECIKEEHLPYIWWKRSCRVSEKSAPLVAERVGMLCWARLREAAMQGRCVQEGCGE